MSLVKVLSCSVALKLESLVALKLEITVLFGIPRDLKDSHNFLGLPIVSESFSLKNVCSNQF